MCGTPWNWSVHSQAPLAKARLFQAPAQSLQEPLLTWLLPASPSLRPRGLLA